MRTSILLTSLTLNVELKLLPMTLKCGMKNVSLAINVTKILTNLHFTFMKGMSFVKIATQIIVAKNVQRVRNQFKGPQLLQMGSHFTKVASLAQTAKQSWGHILQLTEKDTVKIAKM